MPLIRTWYVSPLELLRIGGVPTEKPKKRRLVVFKLIILFLYSFIFLLLRDAIFALVLVSSLLLAIFVFNKPFGPSEISFLVFLFGFLLLVLGIGLSNIQTVLKSSPLEVLRREA